MTGSVTDESFRPRLKMGAKRRYLTVPSSGCQAGCAVLSPLMSNVMHSLEPLELCEVRAVHQVKTEAHGSVQAGERRTQVRGWREFFAKSSVRSGSAFLSVRSASHSQARDRPSLLAGWRGFGYAGAVLVSEWVSLGLCITGRPSGSPPAPAQLKRYAFA